MPNADNSTTDWRDSLAVALLFAAIALLLVFPIQDYDTFWHLANGRAMVDGGRIVNEEIFSFTAAGKPFSNHEWLAQTILFLSYNSLGSAGLIGLKILIALTVILILHRTMLGNGCGRIESALLCFLAVYAALFRYTERPQLFSFLGIALLGLIFHGFRTGRYNEKILRWLPCILVMWDFLHGAVYGLAYLGAYLAGESVAFLLNRQWPGVTALSGARLRHLWTWTGITLAAMLINPYGPRSYDIFLQFTGKNTMVSMTGEFLPTPLKGYIPFWALFALTSATLLFTLRRSGPALAITLLPFAYLSVRYTRGIEAFNLVALPIIAALAGPWLSRLTSAKGKTGRILLWILVAIALTFTGHYKFLKPAHLFSFGGGISDTTFPVGSVNFIKETGLTGNLYNTDRFGGYLAWFITPERKIFHYNQHVMFNALERYVHDPATRSQWNINYAIITREDELGMFTRDGFVPVYWEPTGMVMIRDREQNRPLIERYRITTFKPLYTDARLRTIAANPASYARLIREMADYLSFRNDRRLADLFGDLILRPAQDLTPADRLRLLASAEGHNMDNAALTAAHGILLYEIRDLTNARVKLTAALQLDDKLAVARLNLGYVEYDLGQFRPAADQFAQVIKADDKNALAHYGLALAGFRLGDAALARSHGETYLRLAPDGPWADKVRQLIASLPAP